MISNFQKLLVLMSAATAAAALAASMASASTHTPATFRANGIPVKTVHWTMTADGSEGTKASHHVIDIPGTGSAITCNRATMEAVTFGESFSSVTTNTVAHDTCTFLGQPATVNMNGCNYKFNASGTVDIVPNPCGPIFFEANGCKVSIGAQMSLSGVTYTNINSGKEITVAPSINGISGTTSGSCEVNGSFTTGQYTTGNFIWTGAAGEPFLVMAAITWQPTTIDP